MCVCVCIVAAVVVYLGNAVGKKVEVAISQVERMPNILRAAVVYSSYFSLCSSLVFPSVYYTLKTLHKTEATD